MDRAYSVLTIKAAREDERSFEGTASTPALDTQNDIVEPRGAKFELPLPLLWQHNAAQPIGFVTHARVSDDGIHVKARIHRIDEPGKLKDRLDEAWLSVKTGLVRGLSVGFQVLDAEPLRGAQRGKHIKEWAWRELSCVTMAANTTCTVLAVKKADLLVRTSLGLVPVPQPSSLATKMKLALVDSASMRTTPMVTINAIRYRMDVLRDAAGDIASVVLEPVSVVALPKEPA